MGIAYYLALSGVTSTVVERDSIGSHASGFAYGGLSGGIPNGPNINTPLIDYSMSLFPSLVEHLTSETAIDLQFRRRELLRIALTQNDIAELQKHAAWQNQQTNYKVSWLDESEAKKIRKSVQEKSFPIILMDSYLCQTARTLNIFQKHDFQELSATEKDIEKMKCFIWQFSSN